jgi:hypothetical protein
MNKISRIVLAGLMTVGILRGTTQAFASGGGGVTFEGSCSGGSTWKLKLSIDNSRIETEFEVDQNVVGDTWKVILKDNGTVFFRGQAVTKAPSGSFEVRKFTTDRQGTDNVVALAKNIATGETCQGSGSI